MSQADDDDKQPALSRPDDSGAIAVASGNRQTALALKKRPTRPRKRNIGDLSRHIAEAGGGVRLASLAELVRLFGVSEKTMRGWLRMLEQQGKIEREKLPNGILKLVWNGVGGKRPRTSGRTSPRPELTLVQGTSGMTGSVSPSPSPRRLKKPKETSAVEPISQAGALSVTDPQEMLQRTSEGTQERTSERTLPVSAGGTELYTAPPVLTIPLTMPRRNPVLVVFAVVTALVALAFLGGAIYGGLLHAAERAADSVPALIVFAVVIVGAAVFGAIAFPAAEFMPRGWRIGLRCASVACMTYTTAMALGFAAHRYETTASERGHDAAAYAALTEDVERLRRRRDALGEPRPVEVVLADLKAASRADVCNSPKKRKSKECAEYRDKLTAEKTATESLPAIRAELAAKETAWLNTKPIASADAASAGLASVFNSFGDVVSIAGTRKGLWVYGTILGEILAALGFAAAVAMWRQSKA